MVSADNIAFLKQSGRRYIVGTPKSMLKQFERELLSEDWRAIRDGLGHEPRRVFEELDKIQLVDVVLPTRHGPDIRRRCVTQPTDHQAILLAHLKLNLPTLPLTDGV